MIAPDEALNKMDQINLIKMEERLFHCIFES